MKILIDARFIAGGAITHLLGILQNLNKNFDYTLIIRQELEGAMRDFESDIDLIIYKRSDLIRKIIWYLISRAIIVWRLKGDCLICLSGINVYSPCKTVAVFQNILPFEVKAYKFYNLSGKLRLKFFKCLYLKSFKRSDLVICLSQYARDVLSSYSLESKKLAIVGHGMALFERSGTIASFDDKKLKLVYVSNWHPYKSVDFLFGNYEDLPDGLAIEIDLIGGGDKKCVKILEDNVANFCHKKVNIHYLGEMSFEEVQKRLLTRYDAAIFASHAENSPNIVLEYISAGLPILFINYPSVDELIYNKELVFFETNKSFAQAAVNLINMDSHRRFSIANDNQSNIKNVSWATTSDRFWSIVSDV